MNVKYVLSTFVLRVEVWPQQFLAVKRSSDVGHQKPEAASSRLVSDSVEDKTTAIGTTITAVTMFRALLFG